MKGSFLLAIGLYISSCGEVKTTDVADIPSGKVSQSGDSISAKSCCAPGSRVGAISGKRLAPVDSVTQKAANDSF